MPQGYCSCELRLLCLYVAEPCQEPRATTRLQAGSLGQALIIIPFMHACSLAVTIGRDCIRLLTPPSVSLGYAGACPNFRSKQHSDQSACAAGLHIILYKQLHVVIDQVPSLQVACPQQA